MPARSSWRANGSARADPKVHLATIPSACHAAARGGVARGQLPAAPGVVQIALRELGERQGPTLDTETSFAMFDTQLMSVVPPWVSL